MSYALTIPDLRLATVAGLPKQALLVRSCQAALVVYAGTGSFADINQFTKATKYLFILVGLGLGVGARYSSLRSGQEIPSETVLTRELHHA